MILHLKKNIEAGKIAEITTSLNGIHLRNPNQDIVVTSSEKKEIPNSVKDSIEEFWVFEDDIQFASRKYRSSKRQVKIGDIPIGGETNNTILIGGPCSVESEEQIRSSSKQLIELGLTTLRGGCFKPRTSPYSFQGLGQLGLDLMSKMRDEYGLKIVTEVKDATHVQQVIDCADVVQVGAKAMYDQGILKACSKTNKPILIKRGFGSTLKEFVQAAEFVLSGGNENVILCERGIRTFETNTRFTLDLCGVAWLHENTNLPIVLDPSHAMGYSYGVIPLAKACAAMGVDGLLIETHPDPSKAKSDAAQQLNHDEFNELLKAVKPVVESIGYKIV